jgi:hypothetical protein
MESAYALSSNRDELIVVKSKDFSRISVSNALCNDLPSFPHPFTSSRIHLLRSQAISVYSRARNCIPYLAQADLFPDPKMRRRLLRDLVRLWLDLNWSGEWYSTERKHYLACCIMSVPKYHRPDRHLVLKQSEYAAGIDCRQANTIREWHAIFNHGSANSSAI